MHVRAWILAIGVLGAPASAAVPPADTLVVAADTLAVTASRSEGRNRGLLLWRPSPAPHRYLLSVTAVSPPLLERPVLWEASRYHTTLFGADRGAFAGLAAGFLGEWLGVWDERTALAIVGAGAALGAVWGGTAGYDDPAFRIRVRSGP